MKNILIATPLMAAALMISPAMAQNATNPPPAANTTTTTGGAMKSAPATTTAPANTSAQSGNTGAMAGGKINFVTQDSANMWRASKLIGVNVYNENNQKVGDINEIMLDRSGKAEAVVIGVGGFLGMGEHDVGVPFDELQWQNKQQTTASNANTANAPATTGRSVATTNTAAPGANANATAQQDYPQRAILPGATKDALKNAPQFKYNK